MKIWIAKVLSRWIVPFVRSSSHQSFASALPLTNRPLHKWYSLRSHNSSLALSKLHFHLHAISRVILKKSWKVWLFAACKIASCQHNGCRKSTREWGLAFIVWNSVLNTDFAWDQKPTSSPLRSSTWWIWWAYQMSSSMQSAKLQSWDSIFLIASTIGLQILTIWFSFIQWLLLAKVRVMISWDIGDNPPIFFWASGWRHCLPSGSLNKEESDGIGSK